MFNQYQNALQGQAFALENQIAALVSNHPNPYQGLKHKVAFSRLAALWSQIIQTPIRD